MNGLLLILINLDTYTWANYKIKTAARNITRAFVLSTLGGTNPLNSYRNIVFFNQYISQAKTSMCDIRMLKMTQWQPNFRTLHRQTITIPYRIEKPTKCKIFYEDCGYAGAALHSTFRINRISIPTPLLQHHTLSISYVYNIYNTHACGKCSPLDRPYQY